MLLVAKRMNVKNCVFLVMCILLLPVVFAFGISSDYLKDDTLLLAPGAIYEYRINIQNSEEYPLFVNISLNDAENIAHFNASDSVFEIPAKRYDIQIPLYISIPKYTWGGKKYDISYEARPVATPGGGIGFSVVLSRSFKVQVAKNGFIARGVVAPDQGFLDITASIVKDLYAQKFKISGIFFVLTAFVILFSLLWRRSALVSERFAAKIPVQNDSPVNMHYSNLAEFYYVMSSVDGKTFTEYVLQYRNEIYYWLCTVAGEKFARELIFAKTRKEFLMRLKYGLPK